MSPELLQKKCRFWREFEDEEGKKHGECLAVLGFQSIIELADDISSTVENLQNILPLMIPNMPATENGKEEQTQPATQIPTQPEIQKNPEEISKTQP